jgi:hypothetical protein
LTQEGARPPICGLAEILYSKDLHNSQQQVQEKVMRLPNNYLVNQNYDSEQNFL